jgi:hypothetical protein
MLATHNSATGERGGGLLSLLLTPFARCQSKTLVEQYKSGVRLFDIGALATALASMTGESHMYATAIVVFVLSIGKEALDDKFDIWDIIAGCIGCATSIAVYYG